MFAVRGASWQFSFVVFEFLRLTARLYRGFAAATEAALADKAREMFDRASTLLAQDKFVDAYPLLESTLEIFEKVRPCTRRAPGALPTRFRS